MTGPLISCICPTYNRPPAHQALLEEAIESFLRQDYPYRELIIVNDCPGQRLVCDAPGVRIVEPGERIPTLGEKRNFAVAHARGELIAPWDDDDISLPWRLSASLSRLGQAGYFNPGAYWYLPPSGLSADHPVGYAHNCSLMARWAFDIVGGYPPLSVGEDAEIDHALHACIWDVYHPRLRGSPPLPIEEWSYIYRWGVSPAHVSGNAALGQGAYDAIGQRPVVTGTFRLQPHWRHDYVAMTRTVIAERDRRPPAATAAPR